MGYFNLFLSILILNFSSQIVLISFGFTCKCFRLILSMRVWFSILGFSIDFNFKYFISHLTPIGAPLLLSFVLVLIEILSLLARPISLGVRIIANINARHLFLFLSRSLYIFSFNFRVWSFIYSSLCIYLFTWYLTYRCLLKKKL